MVESSFDKKETTSWRLQGTFKRGGNARTPAYWLKNSGLEEANMSASLGWRKANKGMEAFYSLFNTRIGIFSGAHIGNLTDLQNVIASQEPPVNIRDASFSYVFERPYQFVQHQLFKWKGYVELENNQRISLTMSTQYNVRKEFDIVRSETELPQLRLDLLTNIADLVWEHFAEKNVKGSVGLNLMHQNNSINYRYFIPNYSALDVGIWGAEKYQKDNWQFEVGLRYDHRNRFRISDNDKAPFNLLTGNVLLPGPAYGGKVFSGLSGTGVLAYKFDQTLRTSVTVSSAWRSPQINELFSNGLHHGAARIEKGDPFLKTERAFNILGTMVLNKEKWEAELGIYQKWIDDFIYLKPTYPPLLTIRGAFPAFEYAQTNARLTGSDLSVLYKINNHLSTHAKGSILRAFDQKADTWLIQMPADRYETELQYMFVDGKKWKQSLVKVGFQHVTRQKRVPPTGNIEVKDLQGNVSMQSDYIAPPAAYTLFNLEASTTALFRKQRIELVCSVTNLFNVEYRDYMNSFRYFSLDRGRNISLKIKLPF